MDYSEKKPSQTSKFSTGFYIVIAVCLLVIGGTAFMTLRTVKGKTAEPKINSGENDSYNSETPSYNESTPSVPIMPDDNATGVSESKTDVPYEAPEESETYFTRPAEGEIIKGYSESELIYSETYGDLRVHRGIDIGCENGTSLSACFDGTVTEIPEDSSMGTGVVIENKNGIKVKYFAVSDITVNVGDTVKCGDIIGVSATAPGECKDAPHIHVEVYKDSVPVNPNEILGIN